MSSSKTRIASQSIPCNNNSSSTGDLLEFGSPSEHEDPHKGLSSSPEEERGRRLPPAMELSEDDYPSFRVDDDEDDEDAQPVTKKSSSSAAAGNESNDKDDSESDTELRYYDEEGNEIDIHGFQPGQDDDDFWPSPPTPPSIFNVRYATRPVGHQGPDGDDSEEIGPVWTKVLKDAEAAIFDIDSNWQEKVQIQRFQRDDEIHTERQNYCEQEVEKQKMDRPNHRHALQQLVVEAFRWRRIPLMQQLAEDEDCDEQQLDDSDEKANKSISSPTASTTRSLKAVGSHADLEESTGESCGLTTDEEDSTGATPVPVPVTTSALAAHAAATPCPPSSSNELPSMPTAPSVTSSNCSRMSACNRQPWRKQFPLPYHVPPREKADHTTSPLDVADRAMLYGVLDDIDAVMTTSDIGDDGLPKDRYSEVLANLQFLGLFRPKYAEGEETGEEDDGSDDDGEGRDDELFSVADDDEPSDFQEIADDEDQSSEHHNLVEVMDA